MNYVIDIQLAYPSPLPVCEKEIRLWSIMALEKLIPKAELTIRIVEKEEIRELNHQYRKKDKATNVLAFPANLPESVILDYPLLGDVIICPAILLEESQTQNIPLQQHWAHIVIHGVLHLLGYDHIEEKDAIIMQGLEIELLQKLGYANPYITEDDHFE